MENKFICLLPSEEDAVRLYRTFDALFSIHVFPYIKLPLHTTLYYFPKSSLKNNNDVIDWMQNPHLVDKGLIFASTKSVRCFQKDGRDFVCYLPVSSEKIFHLHDDLSNKFKQVYTDPFDFIPHISLFYIDRNLTEEERNLVQKIYADITYLEFDRLAFAIEKKNGIHLLNVKEL